jgi:hypothetical protein
MATSRRIASEREGRSSWVRRQSSISAMVSGDQRAPSWTPIPVGGRPAEAEALAERLIAFLDIVDGDTDREPDADGEEGGDLELDT